MSGLPPGWVTARLDDLVEDKGAVTDGPFGSNLKTEHYTAAGPRVIRLQNIGDGVFVDEQAHVSQDHYDRLSKHHVVSGDVLVASLGEVLPRACVAPPGLGPALVKADCIRVRPGTGIDGRYLMHALNSPAVRAAVAQEIQGVGRQRVNLGVVREVRVPLPPTAEQRRIVDELERRLSHLDAAFRGMSKIRRSIESARDAVRHAAVVGTVVQTLGSDGSSWAAELEADRAVRYEKAKPRALSLSGARNAGVGRWEVCRLGDLAWDWGYGTSTKCSYESSGESVVRIPNIVRGAITFDDVKRAPEGEDLTSLHLDAGDVLFVRTNGSRDLIGRAAVVSEPLSAAFASYLIRFRLVPDPLLMRWISLVVAAPESRRYLVARASSSAGQMNLSLGDIGDLPVPLPPRATAERVVNEAERRISLIDAAERTIAGSLLRAAQLRRSLLATALAGQLVPQDPEDEPATALLDRVRATRTKVGATKTPRRTRKDPAA